MIARFVVLATIAVIGLSQSLAISSPPTGFTTPPSPRQTSNPDFTRGGTIPEGATHDWNLGATGARGWMFSDKLVTSDARQIAVTQVDEGSPADGALRVGDVILGVAGKRFADDPREELGRALTIAESKAGRGTLSLIRWRSGSKRTVRLKLPILGTYSESAPYDCEKSAAILERGCEALAERIADPSYRPNPIVRSLNALALLASGDPEYVPLVREEARWAEEYSGDSFQTWYYGYVIMLLSEYVLATGDDSVMPGLRRLALEAANGQSAVGSWGHRFAQQNGRLAGYGMMNSPGLTLSLSLVLARSAGVDDSVVGLAIERSARLLRFYVGKGAIPYGDHRPWIQSHEDNGKCGMAAVLFNQLGEPEGARYFSRMSVASHGPERDTGHTGNFFNMLWSLPGVAQSGREATGAWMEAFGSWYFDLARRWDGTYLHQGPPQLKGDSYKNWDCSGAYLLAYAMPLRKIFLTGKRPETVRPITDEVAQSLIEDGVGWDNRDRHQYYDGLGVSELFRRLSSWSPIVRERAAIALGRQKEDVTDRLIQGLSSKDLYTRYGSCQGLKLQRQRGADAVPALQKTLRADDLWLRILAAEALAGIGKPARVAIPEMLSLLTEGDAQRDPRGMQQRYFSFALFEGRGGLIGRSLEGVDRALLMKAVRAGLLNEDGRARGSIGSVYENLSYSELEPLLPAIYQAIVEPAPSGIMFADGIRMSGLELFARNRIYEGIDALVDYSKNQKQHASEKRIVKVMAMLVEYGAHAKRVIPRLESVADYFENDEQDFPKRLSLGKAAKVRETIAAIEASNAEPTLIHLN